MTHKDSMTPTAPERKDAQVGAASVVTAEEVRQKLAKLLARAGHRDERIVITLHGERHAALIGMRDFELLQALDDADAA